jgi:nucleoside-diphosphate-sugar epimerase
MSRIKTLVTGGAGFIGSQVVRLLCERGFEVTVLDNLSTGYRKNLAGLDLEFIQGDIRNQTLLEKLMKKVEVIFHLAASIGNVKSLSNPQEDSEVNVVGTLNILEAARKNGVKKIIYSSSAAIFGEPVTIPLAEDHPQNPDSPYGVSKLAGEKHALCFGKLYDLIVVCLRYFNVYGVNQRYDAYGNVIPIFSRALLTDRRLTIYGDGEQTRDFVNVKDVAMANYLSAVKAKKSGVYNVGCGRSITVNELAEYVQKASRISAPLHYAPPRKGEVRHCRADISKLQNDFGFEPQPDILEGLKEYFAWFKEDFREV